MLAGDPESQQSLVARLLVTHTNYVTYSSAHSHPLLPLFPQATSSAIFNLVSASNAPLSRRASRASMSESEEEEEDVWEVEDDK